ncbi:hypothetical protein D046_5650A, partial [Vibrio parahaemolyticus V-223/04]
MYNFNRFFSRHTIK